MIFLLVDSIKIFNYTKCITIEIFILIYVTHTYLLENMADPRRRKNSRENLKCVID